MKTIHSHLLLYALSLLVFIACGQGGKTKEVFTNEHEIHGENRLTPELLWMLGRIGEVSASPDGKNILYPVSWYDWKENKGYRDIYIMDAESDEITAATETLESEVSPQWVSDNKIAFMVKVDNEMQVLTLDLETGVRKQLTSVKGGVEGYKIAPDQSKMLYLKSVSKPTVKDKYPDLKHVDAKITDDLMYRHWDHWVTEYSHIFIADLGEGMIQEGEDIMKEEPWAAPLSPFGGVEQIVWTKDSKGVVYCSKKKQGKEYAESTNSDIYFYDLANGQTVNISEGNLGYDKNPSFSPDGKYLVWESMERDGYESDVNRLAMLNWETRELSIREFEGLNVHNITWGDNSKELYFISNWHGTNNIYKYDAGTGEEDLYAKGQCDYRGLAYTKAGVIAARQSMSYPTELFRVRKGEENVEQLTRVNDKLLAQVEMGDVQERWIETTDGKQMQAWVIYPPNFDPQKKYPALLYCQGGPQSTVSQFFSYRWNFQLMAANDYIIIAPNRRGLPGFGREWNEQISGDYGGQNMQDYLTAIDALAEEPYVDKERLGAIGASYGAFSVYWLAGNHEERFKSFVAHCGIFNLDAMYLSTEEQFFVNWDLKGNFWDGNAAAEKSYKASPHLFVKEWDTPILCIHGEKDFRIPYTQGMQAFHAARLQDIPARFLYFPEEGHWVLSPQNGILWHREFFEWLDQWLKK